jgi:hypothetical protein
LYPACDARAPYYIVCGLSGSTILFHIIPHKRYDFPNTNCRKNTKFVFFLQILSETFLILRRVERDIVINIHRYSCKEPAINSLILMKLEFSEKFSGIKFYEYPSSGKSCSMRTETEMTCVEKKNQLDATELSIALICPICFGHFYAHHQELETTRVLLPPMVCSAWLLAGGGQVQSSRLCVQEEGCCSTVVVQRPSFWTHSLLPCT